jgi:hypothetical protein
MSKGNGWSTTATATATGDAIVFAHNETWH